MLKNLSVAVTLICTSFTFSQISFEKGYYIDNADQRIECLIKNVDWKNNPENFEFKVSTDATPESGNIKTVKEFGIYNVLKYLRSTINVDRSSSVVNQLDRDKTPNFSKEEHFLKVLIEGIAKLYSYEESNLTRYFYQLENSDIEPLVYKKYLNSDNQIATNNEYKQQLWTNLKCPSFKVGKLTNLQYKKTSLMKLFIEYNTCVSSEFVNYNEKEKRDLINITVRPRYNNASLSLDNVSSTKYDIDFGNESGFSLGLDLEYILPFNKNKWSVSIEPTYQSYKATQTIIPDPFFDNQLTVSAKYKSIDVPLSVRHYFFLNNKSKLYVNLSYVTSFSMNSNIDYKRKDGSTFYDFKISNRNNFAFGIGYKFKDRYNVEARYNSPRKVLNQTYWNSKYESTSIVLGYSIF